MRWSTSCCVSCRLLLVSPVRRPMGFPYETSSERRIPQSGEVVPLCLDRHITSGLYCDHGDLVRRRRGAPSTGHPEPAALLGALGGRDRAQASTLAAVRLQAPARAARGGVRGITHRSAAAPLSPATGAAEGARRLAGSLPALLVEARRCPREAPGKDGAGTLRERKETA